MDKDINELTKLFEKLRLAEEEIIKCSESDIQLTHTDGPAANCSAREESQEEAGSSRLSVLQNVHITKELQTTSTNPFLLCKLSRDCDQKEPHM